MCDLLFKYYINCQHCFLIWHVYEMKLSLKIDVIFGEQENNGMIGWALIVNE